MRNLLLLLLGIVLLPLWLAACHVILKKPVPPDLPNFREVIPGIYRGGQPTAGGWVRLKALGVTNVVKLNTESEGSDNPARRLGMTVSYCPINLWSQLMGPVSRSNVLTAVYAITPGTYVHCEHGQDRTGLVIAEWRYWTRGWSRQDAETEMLLNDFHRELHGLWDFWEDGL